MSGMSLQEDGIPKNILKDVYEQTKMLDIL